MWKQCQILFSWAPKSLWIVTSAMKSKTLAPWKKSYKEFSVLKSRGITLPTKICIVKAMVFPVVIYGCGRWTLKKAESPRIDAFVLWCWGTLLRVSWTARRSNQSILKEIKPEYSLEGPMLKLKLQYFGYLLQKAISLEKTLMLGKNKGKRSRGQQRVRLLHSITDSMDMSLRKFQEIVQDRKCLVCFNSWGQKEQDMTQQLSNNNKGDRFTRTQSSIQCGG